MSNDSATDPAPLHLRGREGEPPDYHFSREVMPGERVTQHAAGSLADIVERLVQVFEMELSHKKDPAQWVSMVSDQCTALVEKAVAEFGRIDILVNNAGVG
ncbi:SDR family NAD(P)-dependent oxidoreductase, partial [Frankia sp. Cpl3]|nr:SDR family NAD(P)-dependent oxidoreductase [Frankia sp. Cpl3]